MDARTCPSLDQMEGMIENTCGEQSNKIFFDGFDAPWKGYY